jgi:hypothetical protein
VYFLKSQEAKARSRFPRGMTERTATAKTNIGPWRKALSGHAGVDGVAGSSTGVLMRPRTFAEDDGVWVGNERGRGLRSAPLFIYWWPSCIG